MNVLPTLGLLMLETRFPRARGDIGHPASLDCTDIPPYADAVWSATGHEVHDIGTLLRDRFGALSAQPA